MFNKISPGANKGLEVITVAVGVNGVKLQTNDTLSSPDKVSNMDTTHRQLFRFEV